LSIAEFARYEKALVGVAKTTGLAGKELEVFSDDIKGLSKELKGGASSIELLNIAEAAGQLGVSGSANLRPCRGCCSNNISQNINSNGRRC